MSQLKLLVLVTSEAMLSCLLEYFLSVPTIVHPMLLWGGGQFHMRPGFLFFPGQDEKAGLRR